MAFEGLTEKLANAFKKMKSRGRLTESDVKEAMREVRLALLDADVNYKVAKDFTAAVTEQAIGENVTESLTPAQMVIKIVNQQLTRLMGESEAKLNVASKGPTVVLFCGLQGSGKTTHAAKLALRLREQGSRPLLVACDVYRPAAIDQLKVVGERAGAPVFEKGTQDPVKTAAEALRYARDYGHDYLLVDTAGRLHIDVALMDELRRMKEALHPNEVLLVVDSMTGQDAVTVAQSFNEALGIDGVILTKLDGDARGGAALSIRAVTGKPIKFVGTGEKLEDLEVFHPDRMASRILGMGDILSLIEQAESQLDEKKAEEMARKLEENRFDLTDLLDQFQQIKKMGSLKKMLGMLPGMERQLKNVEIDDRQIDRTEAIILSMTPAERQKPELINPSRKRRIAAGCGMKVEDVNRLLRQYEQMRQMMKQMRRGKGKKGRRGFGPMGPGGNLSSMLPPGFKG